MSEEVNKAINYIQDSFKATIIHKENFEIVLNYIDNLQKENEKLKQDKNKLINYIAIREDKTYEDILKEFELGE